MTLSPETSACLHCRLPIPVALLRQGRLYCCRGCEAASLLLRDHGLEDLYVATKEDRPSSAPLPPPIGEEAYAHFDDTAFFQLYVQMRDLVEGQPPLASTELYLEGLHCAACIGLLEKLPSLLPGIREARVDYTRSSIRLLWYPHQQPLSAIARFLDRLGYPSHPYKDLLQEKILRQEDRKMLIRIAVSGAIAGNVMLLAFALYSGMFADMTAEYRSFFRWLSLLLTIPSVVWAGWPFFQSAIAALRTRTLHMDIPIAVGIAAGFFGGAYHTFEGKGEIYFDSVTTLIFLLLVGRWLQRRQQRLAATATTLMTCLAPSSARRLEDGEFRSISIEALQKGDRVEVRAGEVFPADGTVLSGSSQIDTALLTGEATPHAIHAGSPVFAGTLNLSAPLQIQIDKAGSETRLGQILRDVEESSQNRAVIVQAADRLAGVFILGVLLLAVFTILFWLPSGLSTAAEHAIALLIVCCPCALALATPLAISASLGKAAKQGILIKGGSLLEALATPGTLWLDKTGTLTEGRLSLLSWYGDKRFQPWVRAIEEGSSHPIALALVRDLPKAPDSEALEVTSLKQTVGQGIEAAIEGRRVQVGSASWLLPSIRADVSGLSEGIARLQAEALVLEKTEKSETPILIAVDGVLQAIASVGDLLRPEASAILQGLSSQGWTIGILSGDHPRVVQAIGARLGLAEERCLGGLSPEEKQAHVVASGQKPVVMVGDGVNDAAALAAATVGIGVHGGAEACLRIADIYLASPGLQPLALLLHGAKKTLRTIRWGLGLSLLYNLFGATLAVLGLIHPLTAAILMPLSSLSVVSIAYRSSSFSPNTTPSTLAARPSSSAPLHAEMPTPMA